MGLYNKAVCGSSHYVQVVWDVAHVHEGDAQRQQGEAEDPFHHAQYGVAASVLRGGRIQRRGSGKRDMFSLTSRLLFLKLVCCF